MQSQWQRLNGGLRPSRMSFVRCAFIGHGMLCISSGSLQRAHINSKTHFACLLLTGWNPWTKRATKRSKDRSGPMWCFAFNDAAWWASFQFIIGEARDSCGHQNLVLLFKPNRGAAGILNMLWDSPLPAGSCLFAFASACNIKLDWDEHLRRSVLLLQPSGSTENVALLLPLWALV